MGVVCFIVDGLPVAKGRPRAFRVGNFIRHHTPKKTENYEAWVRGCASAAMEDRDVLTGTCQMVVDFALPVPASWPSWKREAAVQGHVKPGGRPDLDNLVKAVKDSCNGIVFKDDSQVVMLETTKYYADKPAAHIQVRPIEHITTAAEWKAHKRREALVLEPSADLFGTAA